MKVRARERIWRRMRRDAPRRARVVVVVGGGGGGGAFSVVMVEDLGGVVDGGGSLRSAIVSCLRKCTVTGS